MMQSGRIQALAGPHGHRIRIRSTEDFRHGAAPNTPYLIAVFSLFLSPLIGISIHSACSMNRMSGQPSMRTSLVANVLLNLHVRSKEATLRRSTITEQETHSPAYQDGFKAGQKWAEDNTKSMGDRLLDEDDYAAGCAAGAGRWLATHGPSSGLLQGGHRRPQRPKAGNPDEQGV